MFNKRPNSSISTSAGIRPLSGTRLGLFLIAFLFSMTMIGSSFGAASAAPASTLAGGGTGRTEPSTGTITGTVVSKGADNFTLSFPNSATQLTLQVTSSTQFFQNGQSTNFAALQVGMTVVVQAQSQGAGNPYLALQVTLPSSDATPTPTAKPTATPQCYTSTLQSAIVMSKNNDSFTVKWPNGEVSTVAFKVNGDTKFYYQDQPATFADLAVGQYIHFTIKSCGNQIYYAVSVYISSLTPVPTVTPKPIPTPTATPQCTTSALLEGVVYSKTTNGFTVQWSNGEVSTIVFIVNKDTRIYYNGHVASFGDLLVGQHIHFTLKGCGNQMYYAVTVYIDSSTPTPTATPVPTVTPKPTPTAAPQCSTSSLMTAVVYSKTSNSFTVKWSNGEVSAVAFIVNGDTKFYHQNLPASFADLAVGQTIQFTAKSCGNAVYYAVSVSF